MIAPPPYGPKFCENLQELRKTVVSLALIAPPSPVGPALFDLKLQLLKVALASLNQTAPLLPGRPNDY